MNCYHPSCSHCPTWQSLQRSARHQDFLKHEKKRAAFDATRMGRLFNIRVPAAFVFFGILLGLSMICLGLVNTGTTGSIIALCIAVAFFGNMAWEDYRSKYIDVRQLLILVFCFFFCTAMPKTTFLFLLVFYFAFFHIVYLLFAILLTLSFGKPVSESHASKPITILSGKASVTESGIPFLPCFMGGIVVSCFIAIMIHQNLSSLIVDFVNQLFDINAIVVASNWKPDLIACMLAVCGVLEIIKHVITQSFELVTFIGEGDTLTFPAFGAFLGTPLFFFSIGLSFAVAFVFAAIQEYRQKKTAKKPYRSHLLY